MGAGDSNGDAQGQGDGRYSMGDVAGDGAGAGISTGSGDGRVLPPVDNNFCVSVDTVKIIADVEAYAVAATILSDDIYTELVSSTGVLAEIEMNSIYCEVIKNECCQSDSCTTQAQC